MRRLALSLAAAVCLAALGCEREPAPQPQPLPSDPLSAGPRRIVAEIPGNGAENIPLRPKFRWQLPPAIPVPTLVSLTLVQVAGSDEPAPDDADEMPLAKISGLHDTSPTEVDLFDPPTGAIVSGPVTEMTALAPETWYRWTVRVMGNQDYARRHFYFRTGPAPAAPASAP